MLNNKLVCILDYGSGNVKSVFNLVSFLGYNVKISNKINDIRQIILSTNLVLFVYSCILLYTQTSIPTYNNLNIRLIDLSDDSYIIKPIINDAIITNSVTVLTNISNTFIY